MTAVLLALGLHAPMTLDAPRIGEGHQPLPPLVIPAAEPQKDRRLVYLGFGIVVLAGGFWWNRRRRERFEREEASE